MDEREQPHPLQFTGLAPWLRLLATSGGVSPRYLGRAAAITATSLAGLPFRLVERARWSARVARTPLPHAPLFVVGHWRSGTTHLHNLLARDPALGCVSYLHCAVPATFLTFGEPLRRHLERTLPAARPMDAVAVGVDEPTEEELELARLSALSYNHAYHVPRRAREHFARAVLFEGVDARERAAWLDTLETFLRKVSIEQGGRRLALKNPAHTARIPHLLERFPDARFVHIHRNPFEVYASTLHLWRSLLPLWSLQRWDPEALEPLVLELYRRLMRRYLADRDAVPPGRLAEVAFDDLQARPLEELGRVYDELGLGGFDEARPAIERYLATLAGYRGNRHALTPGDVERVRDAWGFALERFGYAVPRGGPLTVAGAAR